jgi:hypothetical protein
VPVSTLYRLAGAAGLLTGVLLLVNDLRREDLLPENALTHSIAPVPAVLALFMLTGLYLWQRDQAGRLGLVGYALNSAGVAGLLVGEFAAHFLFADLTTAEVDALVDGRPRAAFLVIAAVFAVGVVLFSIASWRAGAYPRWAIALYLVGFLLAAGRNAVPDLVVSFGFLLGSVGVLGLAATLWRASAPAPTPVAGAV